MRIKVQVVLAWADHDWRCQLELDSPVTADQALRESGVAKQVDGMDPWRHGVALFGRRILPEYQLLSGDRLEILRPLQFDPMESRRRRAEHRKGSAAANASGQKVSSQKVSSQKGSSLKDSNSKAPSFKSSKL